MRLLVLSFLSLFILTRPTVQVFYLDQLDPELDSFGYPMLLIGSIIALYGLLLDKYQRKQKSQN